MRNSVKGTRKTGGTYEINTARTGVLPGPSAVGTQGPKEKNANNEWFNPRSPNEISGILHEFGIHNLYNLDNKKIYDHLVINGLSGGVTHHPSKGLTISPATTRYGKLIDKINNTSIPGAEQGFLAKLEEIVANKKECKPLKVLEYKSIPWIFIEHPEFTVEQYLRYIDLAEQTRDNGWSQDEFFMKLDQAKINLPAAYYDPKNPTITEEELTNKIRRGMLGCLTPHAFDSDNIVRSDLKLEIYKNLARFCRLPEVKEWAEKELGIPKTADLLCINGKDVSHVDFDNFEKQYPKGLSELIPWLKDKGKDNPHAIIKVSENLQPYCEIAPNSSKADVLPSIEDTTKNNLFVIAGGDSPGTDAEMLAQAIILGGAGFITRGLMTPDDVTNKIVEYLAKAKNQWHKYALTEAGKNKEGEPLYKNLSGEVNSKSEWKKFFGEVYKDQILRCNNIHENNAFNASFFSEFFAGDKEFDLKLNENHAWAQDVLNQTNKQSLATPLSEASEQALKGQEYVRPLLERFPILASVPAIKYLFDISNAGPIFDNLLNYVSKTLMIAAPIDVAAGLLKMPTLSYIAKLSQRFAYAANTLASGVSRGLLLSAHQFPWQFIGECFGLTSTFFKSESILGETFRALSNLVLIGRANELAMRSNYNLDEFAKDKDTQTAVKEAYQGDSEKYKVKSEVFAKKTKARMDLVEYLEEKMLGGILGKIPMVGPLFAKAVADLKQAVGMSAEFVKHKVLHQGYLKNIFTLSPVGLTKVSKNSGKSYAERHEEHAYAFTGVLTAATAVSSMLLSKFGFKKLSVALSNAANMIPGIGLFTAGKLVYQDQAGDPRLFTDINKRQQSYSPEKSGLWQMAGGWGQIIFGAFMNKSWGQAMYNLFTGGYLHGINQQLKVGIDDTVVNNRTRQGRYYITNSPNGNGHLVGRALAA